MGVATRRAGAVLAALGLLLAAGFMVVPESRADMGLHAHRGGHGDFASRMMHGLLWAKKELNLSEEQVSKLKTIATDYAKTRIKGKAEVKLADVDVRVLFFDEKAEFSAIEEAIRKSESAKTALRIERAKAVRAALAVLTPEQREKWRDVVRERYRDSRRAADSEREPGTFDLAQNQ